MHAYVCVYAFVYMYALSSCVQVCVCIPLAHKAKHFYANQETLPNHYQDTQGQSQLNRNNICKFRSSSGSGSS